MESFGTATPSQEVEYVDFTPRLYASVIDTILSVIILAPILSLLVSLYFGGQVPSNMLGQIVQQQASHDEAALREQFQSFVETGGAKGLVIEQAMQIVIAALVVLVFWHYRSATPGKIILRMRIVDADTFAPPTTWQYIRRFLGYILSILPLMLGFFWMKWDPRHQCFHDKVANTVVIKVPKKAKSA
ncbi:MAG: hypothetical protein K0R63_1550 [Rickettsiales bacterium]|jgi:uncharacterized RDD family membrane protein YckC|nr:hypothetical protein [Rickettsiales bacterium]